MYFLLTFNVFVEMLQIMHSTEIIPHNAKFNSTNTITYSGIYVKIHQAEKLTPSKQYTYLYLLEYLYITFYY